MKKHLTTNQIHTLLYEVLKKENVQEFSANAVVDGLLHASLRGVDSHGFRLFPHYLSALKGGRINGQPDFSFEQTSPSTGILNADDAFGHAAGMKAVENVINLADSAGIGSVSVRKSTHFGAASFFSLKIAKNDLLGFSFTNSDPLILPTNGKIPYLGNNPICFTAPCADEEPICLDMATSMVTFNKVLRFRENNTEAPRGIGFDKNGIETTDPNEIVGLAPAGEHKGYGLSLMVEVLCSLLSTMPFGPHIGHMYNDPLDTKRNIGQFFMAIKIGNFTDPEKFKQRLKEMVNELRDLESIDPDKSVMVAGDPEKIISIERGKRGIPLMPNEIKYLVELSEKYDLLLPEIQ